MLLLPPLLIGTLENGEEDIIATVNNKSIKHRKPANKQAMEYLHMRHFQEQLNVEYPDLSFTTPISSKTEPPDFYITRSDKKIGLELTMLIFRNLRQEVKFFSEIQERLLRKFEQGQLQNLGAISIDLEFMDHPDNRPSKVDDKTLEELITALNNLASKPYDFQNMTYPVGQNGLIGNGVIKWSVTDIVVGNFEPITPLGFAAGFEVGHSLKHFTKHDIFSLLQNTIDAKDVEKNAGNELLISVGMPDIDGWATTIEAQILFSYFGEWEKGYKGTKYLSRVYLDNWLNNKIYIL